MAVRLAAGLMGALFLAGGPATADGGNEAPTCLSYREAKARWPGAYMTWRYDSRKWQCWAPRGVAFRTEKNRSKPNPPPVEAKNAHNLHNLRTSDDIAPDFPQPEAVRIEQIPWPHPGGLGWVWEAKEPFQPQRVGDDEIVAPPVTIYSTFDGEPPDVWPAQSKTAGSGLPAVLLLALLAGGGLTMTTAGLLAIRLRP